MIGIKLTIDKLEFDRVGYSKFFRANMMRTMRQVSRVFVRAAIIYVPVQTGMARGTFLNISRLVGKLAVPIQPTVFKQTYRGLGGLRLPKTPETGASLATKNESEVFQDTGRSFIFNYGNSVWHYNINEFFGGHSPSAPWFSYFLGRQSAVSWLRENLGKRFPSIKDFIIVTRVAVGVDGSVRTNRFRLKPKTGEFINQSE